MSSNPPLLQFLNVHILSCHILSGQVMPSGSFDFVYTLFAIPGLLPLEYTWHCFLRPKLRRKFEDEILKWGWGLALMAGSYQVDRAGQPTAPLTPEMFNVFQTHKIDCSRALVGFHSHTIWKMSIAL